MKKSEKIIKTTFLVLVWFCIGLCLEITGPTLIDIKLRVEADYEEVAVALSGRFVGYFIGSVIGGVLVDKFSSYCDLIIGVCLTGLTASTICVPFSPTVALLWFIIVVQGTFDGLINIVGLKLILGIWKEDAASPLHILQGGFGMGSFIIPMIANPFLAIPRPGTSQNTSLISLVNTTYVYAHAPTSASVTRQKWSLSSVTSENGTHLYQEDGFKAESDSGEYLRESRIEIPYFIAALVTLILSSVFFAYHIRGRRKQAAVRKSDTKRGVETKRVTRDKQHVLGGFKKMINPGTCADGRLLYGVEMFGLLSLYFANIVGGEGIVGKFIRAFSIEQLDFSVNEGTYINTVFWLTFTIGRILGFVTARYIPIRILILAESGGLFVASILLNIFAPTDATALWVLSLFVGLFIGPGYPSGIGWADYHVELTGMAIAFLSLSGSVGGVVYLRLAGFLFESYGPRSLLYHVMGFGIAAFVLSVLLDIVGSQHGNRFEKAKHEDEPNVTQETEMMEKAKMIEGGE